MSRTEVHGTDRSRHRHNYWQHHDRSTYQCPKCGQSEPDVEQFEVHHIDGDPENGDLDNLVALCQACHYNEHDREPPESLAEWKDRVTDPSEVKRAARELSHRVDDDFMQEVCRAVVEHADREEAS